MSFWFPWNERVLKPFLILHDINTFWRVQTGYCIECHSVWIWLCFLKTWLSFLIFLEWPRKRCVFLMTSYKEVHEVLFPYQGQNLWSLDNAWSAMFLHCEVAIFLLKWVIYEKILRDYVNILLLIKLPSFSILKRIQNKPHTHKKIVSKLLSLHRMSSKYMSVVKLS